MAWLSVNYRSRVLNMPVDLEIICPQNGNDSTKVVFLLHGAIGDRASWLLRSQIEYFASQKNICVVMPTVKNSFYINTANGYKYMDFICKELIAYVKNMFHVSSKKEDWLIAGCSMGGYGALRCGLEAKEEFGYIGAFSFVCDIEEIYDKPSFIDIRNTFGTKEEYLKSNNDLYGLMKEAGDSHILLACGKQDDLYGSNVNFYNRFKGQYDISFFSKDGGHDWDLWNDALKLTLEWFCNEAHKEVI